MDAMETSSHVDSDMSYQIVAKLLEKVAKFRSVCFNINVYSRVRAEFAPPPPGLNRVKGAVLQF